MHIRDGVHENTALISSILEASWPCPWSWDSSPWSSPWTASPWPWAISPWPWVPSPWSYLGLSVLDLGLSVLGLGLGSCPWHWPSAFKSSGNEPSTHFHSHKCQEVLRFHSWAVLFSWLCGFMEGGPAGSRFPSTPSPAGKYLLQHSHLGTG